MQDMTSFPRVSSSSLKDLTAHCLQAPTEPMAGCQQKYGRSNPSERQASRTFLPSLTSYGALSMKSVAIATFLFVNMMFKVLSEIVQRTLQGSHGAGRQSAERFTRYQRLSMHCQQDQIVFTHFPNFQRA